MRALVVGRFQPLHDGHVHLVRRALQECGEGNVAVAIGSSASPPSVRNPFGLEERKAMLAAVFPSLPVFAVPDVGDDARWVAHALAITGPVGKAYGNDDRTLRLFEAAGVPVARPGLWERNAWEGTRIRALLAADDPAWRKAVPKEVATLLDKWDAPRRLRMLQTD